MSRWRIIMVGGLIAVPFLVLAGLGSFFLWSKHLGFVVWWPMAACMILGYGLGWYWAHKNLLLRPVDFAPSEHWTERDRQAWLLVEARAKTAAKLSPEQMGELQFYIDTAGAMALELARFYHPHTRDPVSALTIPEILAVVELASHDLADMVDQYLPGSHLLTIKNWRQAQQITDWYKTANNIYWIISALFSPVNTGLRYMASQAGMAQPWQMVQRNLIAWFYTAFVQRVGNYLIEVNSGRLRIGVRRYRELMNRPRAEEMPSPVETEPADQIGQITIMVMGQVKAGKSSFINAVLGEQRARTDVLPATNEITRYELRSEGIPTRLVLLDTVGYGHSGPREDQLRATEEAARQSDLLVLIMHARNPARQADLEMLQKLQAWFAAKAELRMPPILGVLTHIDLLSPAMEWAPPYDWPRPQRPKEQQIHQAWEAVRQQLGSYLAGVVPLCTVSGKVYGIEEWLLPTLAELLDEAHTVALLRCIRAEANAGKVRKIVRQLLEVGKQTALILLEGPHS